MNVTSFAYLYVNKILRNQMKWSVQFSQRKSYSITSVRKRNHIRTNILYLRKRARKSQQCVQSNYQLKWRYFHS